MMSSGAEGFTLEGIVEAVRVILDAASHPSSRQQAHALCEAVKCHPQAALYGFQLTTRQMPLSARLFGLNVLEHYVRTRMQLEEASALRDGVWALLGLVVAVPPAERRLMQEKTAMLIAQLALRIWPQCWPDFFDRLLELVVGVGSTLEQDAAAVVRTEMGLLMVRVLVDEIHPREGAATVAASGQLIWDDSRRPELQRALTVVLPAMIQRLYMLLPHCSRWTGPQMELMRPLLEALLTAFGSTALWVPLEAGPTIECVTALLRIAHTSPDLASTALDVFAIFAARPASPSEQLELVPPLFDAIVEPVGALLAAYATVEGYEHFKRLSDAFVTLCSTHIAHRKSPALPAQRLDAVLDLLIQLANFPSLLVVSNVVGSFWTPAARIERLFVHPAMRPRLPALFLFTLVTMAQAEASERRREPFNVEDFEPGDDEASADFKLLFASNQCRTMDLLRQAATHHPTVFMEFAVGALKTFVRERGGYAHMGGALSPAELAQWTALGHALESVLRAAGAALETASEAAGGAETDEARQRRTALIAQMDAVAAALWIDDPAATLHPDTLFAWLLPMRPLITGLGLLASPTFSPLVQHLFTLTLHYQVPAGLLHPPQRTIDMQVAVRARASATILRVCQGNPALFTPALDYLVGLFRQLPGLPALGKEARLLVEMLLVIAGAMGDSEQRAELLRLVLSPVMQALEAAAAAPIASLVGEQSSAPEAVAARRTITHTNGITYTVLTHLKRLAIAGDVRSIINQVVPPTARALAQIIRTLRTLPRFADEDARMMAGDVEEQQGGDQPPQSQSSSTTALVPTDRMLDSAIITQDPATLASAGAWLEMLRVCTFLNYGLLFGLAPHSMYSEAGLAPLGLEQAASISITQWTLMSKHLLGPLLLSCPESAVPGVRPVLAALLEEFGLRRLGRAWETHLASADRPEATSARGLQAEAARERLLSTATSILIVLLFDTLVPVGERDKRSDPTLDPAALKDPLRLSTAEGAHSPLARYIAHDPKLSASLLALLTSMLRWRPAITLGKTLAILLRWMPVLMSHPAHRPTLYGPVTASLLADAANTGLAESHGVIGMVLTELCKWNLLYPAPDNLFDLQLAAITPTMPQEVKGYFESSPTANIRAQRTAIKSIILKPLQLAGMTAAGVTSTAPRLPDRLVIIKKLKQLPEETSLDLASFFDQ